MAGHLGEVVMGEHRDVTEQIVEAVGRLEIIELLPPANEIADREHPLARAWRRTPDRGPGQEPRPCATRFAARGSRSARRVPGFRDDRGGAGRCPRGKARPRASPTAPSAARTAGPTPHGPRRRRSPSPGRRNRTTNARARRRGRSGPGTCQSSFLRAIKNPPEGRVEVGWFKTVKARVSLSQPRRDNNSQSGSRRGSSIAFSHAPHERARLSSRPH